MDNLEEDLTCSVCYALFTDPRVLPCSHTFCKCCLESVLQVSSNYSIWRPLRLPLKCPNCRSVVELPPTGVDALPINVSLRAIIEKFQRDGGPHGRPPTCPEHPRQPLNVYCVQDRALICGFCLTVGRHQGHAIDDLQAAYVRERDAPEQLVQQLTDTRWAEVCALAERLEQEKARGEGLVRQDREAVGQFFQGVQRLLERKRDEYMAALDAASAELARSYDPLIEKLKDMQEEQLSLISLGSAVQDEESPLAFLEKVHLFRARVSSLTQTPMPQVVPLYIAPRAGDFLREHWAKVTIGGLEQGPVPKVACHTRGCLGKPAPPAGLSRAWPDPRQRPLPLFALLVLLVAAGLHLDPFGMASLGLSVVAPLGELLQSLADQLVWPFDVQGLLEELVSNVCASVFSLADKTYQHFAFFLQASQ
ncbi:tripartite motif-containing protein 59 [Alosa sapidissima]|uniref:tripartite motif-containing protein 59 n=1 Tax=Alosa sapidissima TaxID=34773 RepID=UPI001C088810|nr:tripartite motif-containing protein 59 [Alosa sapidissima]